MIYKPFDIIIISFQFTDKTSKESYRPALVISSEEYNKKTGCTVLVMITSTKHSNFWNDYKIQDYGNTNLQGECLIRFKPFTLDNSMLKGKIGELSKTDISSVRKILKNICNCTYE